MKRKGLVFLFLLLATMLMVATAVAQEATPDDVVPEHDYHYTLCDKPDVCAVYGEPYNGDNIQRTGGSTFISDEEYHYEVCAGRGEVVSQNRHSSECMNPGVCSGCGSPYDGDNIWHIGRIETSDETYHYNLCESCGEVLRQGEHYESCIEPGVCEYCGAKGNMAWAEHAGPVEWEISETEHIGTCEACGEKYRYHHWWTCTEPGVCAECGAPYTDDEPSHWNGSIIYIKKG